VIKILKDVCVLQPDFPKISDIYVRILRRISDEEAIKVKIGVVVGVVSLYRTGVNENVCCVVYLCVATGDQCFSGALVCSCREPQS